MLLILVRPDGTLLCVNCGLQAQTHEDTIMCFAKILSEILSNLSGMFPDALWGTPDQILARGERNAVGVIVFPGSRTELGKLQARLFDLNASLNEWGHTAVYVRHNGVITICLGFDPHRGKMALLTITGGMKDVETGKTPTPGQIYAEGSLIGFPGTFAAEFKLNEQQAGLLSHALSKYSVGENGHYDTSIVEKPAPYRSDRGNCISFVRSVLATTLRVDIYSSVPELFGTPFTPVGEVHDFGAKQGRFTPLVQGEHLLLADVDQTSLVPIKIVPKRSLQELTHELTDTYMRSTFARVLLGGCASIAGSLLGYFLPSQLSLLRDGASWAFPALGRHHYAVSVCYTLLAMRTALPGCTTSSTWKVLYQAINLLSIISFVQFARTGNQSALQLATYEVGRTVAFMLGTRLWKSSFR